MLRGKENKIKSCVKFVCSKAKQSVAAAPYSLHLTDNGALEIVCQ